MSKDKKKRINAVMAFMPTGRDNAVPMKYVAQMTGMSERDVRSAVNDARLSGHMIVGTAVTLRSIPVEKTTTQGLIDHDFIKMASREVNYLAEPGDVLVGDAGGMTEMSSMGGQSFVSAKIRGLEGVVLDGAVRDVGEIRKYGVPTWCRGATPRTGKCRIEAIEIKLVKKSASWRTKLTSTPRSSGTRSMGCSLLRVSSSSMALARATFSTEGMEAPPPWEVSRSSSSLMTERGMKRFFCKYRMDSRRFTSFCE